MKKIFLTLPFLTILFFIPQLTHAGACYEDPIYEVNQTYKVTSAVFVRDNACMDGTSVVATLSTNELVQVIAKTDGWFKVRRADGTEGWSGETFFQLASADLQPQVKEPLWDVGDHMYKDAIWNLYNAGVVTGNATDKSYEPDAKINRAAFTTIAVRATTESVPKSETGCLKDIAPGVWYTDFICYANSTYINGEPIVKGHPNGYFMPADNIRFSELSKILALLYGLEIGEGQVWYEGYIQALSDVNAIAPTIKTPDHFVTRGEMAEIIDRLMQKDTERTSTNFNYTIQMPGDPVETLEQSDLAACVEASSPEGFDVAALQNKALQLANQARSERGLPPLSSSDVLNASSMIWALNEEFTHDRPNGQDLGEYENSIGVIGYSLFGENLGIWGCQEDCTQEALTGLEAVHQLFMDEEDLPEGERGHFENITGDYEEMGFGFSIQDGILFMVFQYGKGIEGDAEQLCGNL